MHTCTHKHIPVYVHMHHIQKYVHIYTDIHTHTYRCRQTHAHTHTHTHNTTTITVPVCLTYTILAVLLLTTRNILHTSHANAQEGAQMREHIHICKCFTKFCISKFFYIHHTYATRSA